MPNHRMNKGARATWGSAFTATMKGCDTREAKGRAAERQPDHETRQGPEREAQHGFEQGRAQVVPEVAGDHPFPQPGPGTARAC